MLAIGASSETDYNKEADATRATAFEEGLGLRLDGTQPIERGTATFI